MKTYTVHLVDSLAGREGALGTITIQAKDLLSAVKIAEAMFSNGYIGTWVKEEDE